MNVMFSIFSFLNNFYKINNKNINNEPDAQLIKYFKAEFGSSWKLELDKYLLKNEDLNDNKAA